MAKSKGTDPKKETEARIKRTEAYAEKVRLLFAQTVNDILALNKTMPELDDGVMFSFDGESMKKQKEVEALLRRLHSAVTLAIREGVDVEWAKANAEADRLIKSVFGRKVLDSPEFTAWTRRNTEARDAFLARSEKGLNLSDRVWKSVNQLRDEMEVAITVSVGEGKSASAMSREVRQYLNDPDLMFRRFRYKKGEDDGGNPIYGRKWKKRVKDEATGQYRWIDYDRDSYPTGQGVYKSSAKNAMRLTRTETNMAYRRADHERWMQMDFVIGQRIQTAHDHREKDICDKLKGDYPKDFVFDGWHPQCFCFATPILLDDKYTDSMEDMFLRGEDWEGEIRKRAEEHSIRELPDNFKRWVGENGEKIAASRARGTEPYFLRENRAAVDGILGKNNAALSAEKAIRQKVDNYKAIKPEKINAGGVLYSDITGGLATSVKAGITAAINRYRVAESNKEKVNVLKEIVSMKEFSELSRLSTAKGKIYGFNVGQYDAMLERGEMPKNIQLAQKFTENGCSVYMLSNPNAVKSGDFIVEQGKKLYYVEGKTLNGKNSLDHLLDKGAKQAERVAVNVIGTDDAAYVAKEIVNAFENSDIEEIILFKRSRMIRVSRKIAKSKHFERDFRDVWNKNK